MHKWRYLNKTKIDFLKIILEKEYEIIKVLKDDKRSLVEIIEINQGKFIFKIPKEKNNRKWQRFINVFRGSDSFRNYKTMDKLEKMGINSTRAVFAGEKRTPFVIDSFLIMEILEGNSIEEKDYPRIIDELNKVHLKGYLHGDSQIQNFMKKDNDICMIDFRLQKNIYGEIGRMYEFIYLRESCKEIDKYYDDIRNRISFKIAWIWKKWLYLHGDIRKVIKGKKHQGIINNIFKKYKK